MKHMDTFKKLEELLKKTGTKKQLIGYSLPEIRYFDGTDSFSDINGWYKSDTLEGSFLLYLNSIK